uniref:Kinetochore-associated protein 1-like n=1 Tax=Saccoglossus kowalevskii TaxID=10224 RepID=A0ABM0M2L6_SACKO|nr:PREDICTED: kinetochore-associated protein 1-like [Saccoglossus kowalevskii]
MTRVRALRCLFALVHGEIIEKLSSRSISDLRDDLQKLLYIGDLEALNISQTILEFTKCNKEGLVRGLWTNHNHEPKAVKLITDLCIDYEIHDIQLWNSLLQQLMAFNMINYLRHILVRISGVCHLWHISSLLRAWKSVLLQPLTTVCQPLSDEQEKQCHQSLLLMTRCPLISDMDMIGFSKQFLRQQMMAHALACLLIIPDVKKKEQQIKALFSVDGCHALILDQIANLTMKRMLLPQAEQIQGAVFENIIETDNYELLLCTSHSHQFKHYLARNQKISTLLLTLLKTSRYEESLKLIELYYQYNPEILPANQPATMVEKDRKKKLHMYLESHGLMKTVEDILVEFK